MSDYKKHLSTKRHHNNQKTLNTNSKTLNTNSNILITNSTNFITDKHHNNEIYKYTCDFCSCKFKRIDNYNKHLSKCCKRLLSIIEDKDKKLQEKEKLLQEKNKQYEKKKEDVNSLLEEKDKQIISLVGELNESFKQNQELSLKIKDNEIEYLKNFNKISIHNTNNKITNITQYIINNYQNAPNIKLPNEIENLDKYITKNTDGAIASIVNDIYCKGKKPEERSIWCVDTSRNKFLLRMDNLWKIDLNGVQFCKDILYTIGNQYINYLNTQKNNNLYNLDEYPSHSFQCMELILKLKDMKKVSNEIKGLLVFESEKLN
jgi:hypothetical protein